MVRPDRRVLWRRSTSEWVSFGMLAFVLLLGAIVAAVVQSAVAVVLLAVLLVGAACFVAIIERPLLRYGDGSYAVRMLATRRAPASELRRAFRIGRLGNAATPGVGALILAGDGDRRLLALHAHPWGDATLDAVAADVEARGIPVLRIPETTTERLRQLHPLLVTWREAEPQKAALLVALLALGFVVLGAVVAVVVAAVVLSSL